MQSNFLSSRYKLHKSLETASIIISLSRSVHLEIIRQRETKLDYDFSLNNFWFNINSLNKPTHKMNSAPANKRAWLRPARSRRGTPGSPGW